MNRKSLALVTSLVLAGPLMAQESATTTPATQTSSVEAKSMFQQLKDSPLDFTFNLGTSAARSDDKAEDFKINGVSQTNRFYLGYKFTAQDQLKAELRTTHKKHNYTDAQLKASDARSNSTDNSVNRTTLKYTRSGMLKQDTHGVNLSSSVEYRYLPDTAIRNATHRYSHVRLGSVVNKSWGNFAADMGAFFAFNQTKNSDVKNRETSNWYVPVSQSYNFTDKLKSSLTEELSIASTASGEKEKTTVDIEAEVGYQVSPEFYVGVTVGGKPLSRVDGTRAAGSTLWTDKIDYGVNFDFTVF